MRLVSGRTALTGGGILSAAAMIITGFTFAGDSVQAQTPSTNTATTTATSTTPATNTATATMTMTATVTTTATTTATATATATATTATATATTATATPTRTSTPMPTATAAPATPTTVPPTSGPTQPANAPINITLTGAEEVPPVTTSATGSFRATPGTGNVCVSYTLAATGTGLTAAHIHTGARGTNGPVVAVLFGPNAAGVSSINRSASVSSADLVGPLAGKTCADLLKEMNAGTAYVNVHSMTNPGGEIRGQVPAAPAAPRTGNATEVGGGMNTGLMLALGLAAAGIAIASAGGFAASRKRG